MQNTTVSNFQGFLEDLKIRLRSIFRRQDTVDAEPQLSSGVISQAMSPSPLSVFIPSRFGGRGQLVHESLAVLEACSYESLPFSLIAGINGALFLQPVSKYAGQKEQEEIFSRFINHGALGGLMITEPDYGSDALQMRTSFRKKDDAYHLQGTKHWGGLTGHADYWLLTARGETGRGDLERTISFFIWDKNLGGIEVEEYYESLGLDMIPYGRSRIDTSIPAERRLTSEGSGVRILLDLLHRSRLQFPGMAMGFLRRLLDEAGRHARNRRVGGRSLSEYDQVQSRLAEIQASYTVCSAMCAFSVDTAGVDRDCSSLGLFANSIKTVITDMMQSAAQGLLQLIGAKGYRRDHFAGRAVVDSRPFQIFEGSNDILYEQIAEHVVKTMKRLAETNLYRFLKRFDPTARAAAFMKDLLDFSLVPGLPQRKMVDLGRIFSRVISMQMVVDLGSRGYRRDLIDNCLSRMKSSIASLVGAFSSPGRELLVDDYRNGSSWRDFLSQPL